MGAYLATCGLLLFGYLPFADHAARLDPQATRVENWHLLRTVNLYLGQILEKGNGSRQIREAIFQLSGNVLLFVPLGFWLVLWYRWSVGRVTAVAFALSTLVEVVQWTTRTGNLDVDDVLLNTLGGTLGALLALFWRRVGGGRLVVRKEQGGN